MTLPNIVNTFIGLFKDTTLVFVVGIFDFLRTIEAARADPKWATPTTTLTGYAFAALFYFICCYGMSRYARRRGSAAARAPAGAEGVAMDDRADRSNASHGARRKWRSRSSACTNGTANFTSCATSICKVGARRTHRHLRPVRRRQVDAAALHQSPGGLAARPHRRRRHRIDRRSQADPCGAPRRRHGVSAVQSVSAPDRAGKLHAGADLGAAHAEEGGRGAGDELSRARQNSGAGRQISGAACPAASSSAWRSRARCA